VTDVRQAVLDVAKTMYAKGIVEGTAGNVSGRLDTDRVVMTPSSLAYDEMTLDDLVVVDLDGEVVEGERGPTSEKDLHLSCYRSYDEVGGVVHCHPTYASMFALIREPIPAVIEEFVVFIGGDVPVCEYRTTGTKELGEEVARNLADRSAALMANHGMVCVGKDTHDALHSALVVEHNARIIHGAKVLGKMHEIPPEVTENFTNIYGFIRNDMWTA